MFHSISMPTLIPLISTPRVNAFQLEKKSPLEIANTTGSACSFFIFFLFLASEYTYS